MRHDVSGEIKLNNEKMVFNQGVGYIEMDSGRSFPDSYSWVQSNDFRKELGITAAVAIIPINLWPFSRRKLACRHNKTSYFWGLICVIWLEGREYRLASYKGAKILKCKHGKMEIGQGKYHLSVTINQHNSQRLVAPQAGAMSRIIKESVSCPARFVFKKNGKIIFDEVSDCAGYEYIKRR
jgi:hypothetical protein